MKRKQEQYYKIYPPAEMNVRIEELLESVLEDGKKIIRQNLVATRDFEEGEVIYTELPVVSALEPSLEVRWCVDAQNLKAYLKTNSPQLGKNVL